MPWHGWVRAEAAGASIRPLDVIPYSPAQSPDIDLLYTAAAGEVERVGRSGTHGDAGAHDSHAGQRRAIAIDAAADGDDIVGFLRNEAAERDVVHVIVGKRLPEVALGAIMQLDRPCSARDGVGKWRARRSTGSGECRAGHSCARVQRRRRSDIPA